MLTNVIQCVSIGSEVSSMISQVAKWGNSQGIRLDKRLLQSLGLCIGDSVKISKEGEKIILEPVHGIDWYLQDYEKSEDVWADVIPKGREVW